ncbi:MAG TPA: hypothetical protein VH234_00450 [Candidatus Saccharimonadales bacterium]|jgi:hypothetical protein|nr:hypothetical protein [Candidatus Saccharimonadales bacterium]
MSATTGPENPYKKETHPPIMDFEDLVIANKALNSAARIGDQTARPTDELVINLPTTH